eukprot:gnl/Chilomastix_caulleri/4700.p2 GENE.gnl/Chilomastix_caulleri/4700~~gnl/Chilomastix_caulleri/4700.p2  ORF type:complete len:94 (+),score=20.18 gnl/Chilomastix_caulleri/4700:269-550(+)
MEQREKLPQWPEVGEKKEITKGGDGGNEKDEEDEKLSGAIANAIVREKPNVRWDDVAGLEKAKAALREAVILPAKFPQLILLGNANQWQGILL